MDDERWDKVFAIVEQTVVILCFLIACGMVIAVCVQMGLNQP